ncbi:DNA replication complex GINS protein Sld5 isoform X2 [Haemaphysalis longicornis]
MDSEPDFTDIAEKCGFVEHREEDVTSAEQVVQKLEEAWQNETFSPELLPYQNDIVDCVRDQLRYMQENLLGVDKANFKATVHRMEVERIQYILTSYIKIRLEKKNTERTSLNSTKVANLIQMTCCLRTKGDLREHAGPDLDEYVFLKVKRQTLGVLVDEGTSQNREGEVIDLDEGSQHIVRYRVIAPLVKDGSVVLF